MIIRYENDLYDQSYLEGFNRPSLLDWLKTITPGISIQVEKQDFWTPSFLLEFFYLEGYYSNPECYGNSFKPLIKNIKWLEDDFYFNTYTFLWIPKNGKEYLSFLKDNGYSLSGNVFSPQSKKLTESKELQVLNPQTNQKMSWNDKNKRIILSESGYFYHDGSFVKEYDKNEYQIVETHLGKELKKKQLLKESSKRVSFKDHWDILSKTLDKDLAEEITLVNEPQEEKDLLTPQELEDMVKIKGNMEKLRKSLYQLLKWKLDCYKEKHTQLTKNKLHIEGVIEKGSLTKEEIKDTYPMYSIMKINIITLESLMEKILGKMLLLENPSFESQLLKDFLLSVNDHENGIMSLKGKTRTTIRNTITSHIATLINGPEAFIQGFQNIILTGCAGIGKTRLAYVISFVYTSIHVLATKNVIIVTKQDMVAPYLGQTGPKTVRQLFNSLEGVLLIDEAYQLSGCPGDKDAYSGDSMTEIVNFVDKYIGLNVIIAAGYKEKMMKCFLKVNEGMPRRFPKRMHLENFASADLYELLFNFIAKKFSSYPISIEDSHFLLFTIHHLNISLDLLDNQAGDMENLSTFLATRILNNKSISGGLVDFLDSKEYLKSQDLVTSLAKEFNKSSRRTIEK